MKLFDLGDPNLDPENDILIPVKRAVARITIPDVEFGDTDFTKEISSKFSSSRVEECQIEALRAAQKSAVSEVLKTLERAVRSETDRVVSSLKKTQQEFTTDLVKDIAADLETLRNQLKDQNATLKRYDELIELINVNNVGLNSIKY